MVKNQIVTITIEDIGNDGEGIGKYEGYTLFVKGALPQDVVKVKVLKAKKTYGYAKVEELISSSPDRVTPKCPVAGRCGGCQLQHYSYAKQLQYKADKVKNCLLRIGGIAEEQLNAITEPIIGMEIPFYYRNKAQYPVGEDKSGNTVMGFYAGHSHNIIDCTDCAIQEPVNAVILPVIKQFMQEKNISAYNEETGKGLLRHVLTRVGFYTKEVMVCLIINGKKFPGAEELAARVAKMIEGFKDTAAKESEGKEAYTLKSFCLNVNTEKTNVILGQEILPVYGDTYITDYIGNIKYQISPLSFYQVNPKQTVKLYEKALEYADLSGNEIVWDLYCGIGTISLFLAQRAKQVYGVEIIPQAIEDAKVNSRINNMNNTEFFVGAAEDVMPAKYKESNGTMKADVICVDPPRKGCEESLLDTVVAMEPKRIVYVSCDPATLARDVKYLEAKNYVLKKVCPVDQFGHTGHVETVVLMTRKSLGIEKQNIWKDGMMGLVTGDALGVPAEFAKRVELKINPVKTMEGYGTYYMPPGTWSDDSSMALATLASIREKEDIDLSDIMDRFVRWLYNGEYTPTGKTFDVGKTCEEAICKYRAEKNYHTCGRTGERANGNGALMRIMPVCLYAYKKVEGGEWNEEHAIQYIHQVSGLTHNHLRSKIACGMYYFMVKNVIDDSGSLLERLDKGLTYARMYYERDDESKEELKHYGRMRVLREFAKCSEDEIKSTGYVVDSLEAAVWCLITTNTVKDCLLKAVNLGDDTDSIGAIAGGLACLYYGYDSVPEEWRKQIIKEKELLDLCEVMGKRYDVI